MLYDSMFSWGHILQAFWRDTAAFVEAQERQSRQDFAHWMELWTTIVHNLTYSGRLPWAGSLELAEWSRTAVEQDAAALLAVGSQCTEILDRLGQLERQIKGVEERLDLLTEHVQGARRKGRSKVAPRRRPPSPEACDGAWRLQWEDAGVREGAAKAGRVCSAWGWSDSGTAARCTCPNSRCAAGSMGTSTRLGIHLTRDIL